MPKTGVSPALAIKVHHVDDGQPIYVATFAAVDVSAAVDLFEIVAPATHQLEIMDCLIGQYSDAGDSQAELLSLLLMRGHTTSGSGGASLTPVPLDPAWPAASATVERANTTVAANGSPATLLSDTMNVAAGWQLPTYMTGRLIVPVSTRLVLRATAPADAITINGSLFWKERLYPT